MKRIEIRRHSVRKPPGVNLTQQGVTLARQVGEALGKFDRVVTSTEPRAFQTAIAMGYAVDEEIELLSSMGEDVDAECPWPASFSQYSAANHQHKATNTYVQQLTEFYTKLADSLPEGGAALVVNHGGVVELSAVACLPEAELSSLGDPVQCCEGIRLEWEEGRFTGVEVLRV